MKVENVPIFYPKTSSAIKRSHKTFLDNFQFSVRVISMENVLKFDFPVSLNFSVMEVTLNS